MSSLAWRPAGTVQFAFMCFINSLTLQKTAFQTPCGEERVAAAHPGAMLLDWGQSHANNSTNNFTRWMTLCPLLVPCLGAVQLTSRDGGSLHVPTVGNHKVKHCRLTCLPGRASWGGHNCGARGLWRRLARSMQDSLATKPGHTTGSPSLN